MVPVFGDVLTSIVRFVVVTVPGEFLACSHARHDVGDLGNLGEVFSTCRKATPVFASGVEPAGPLLVVYEWLDDIIQPPKTIQDWQKRMRYEETRHTKEAGKDRRYGTTYKKYKSNSLEDVGGQLPKAVVNDGKSGAEQR